MTTIRLPSELEEKLEAAAEAGGQPKALFVREALVQYFAGKETEQSAWEVGESYFGKYGSGKGDLSTTYKDRLRGKIGDKLNGKHGSR